MIRVIVLPNCGGVMELAAIDNADRINAIDFRKGKAGIVDVDVVIVIGVA